MSFLIDFLKNKMNEVPETIHNISRVAWIEDLVREENIDKKANKEDSFDEERMHMIKNLSNHGLAHVYTEVKMQKEGKKIPEAYFEEYLKNTELVIKNRSKIEKELLSFIPKHKFEQRFKKWASKSTLIDVDNIWTIKNVDGSEVIIRALSDQIDFTKESMKIESVYCKKNLFTKNMWVKNFGYAKALQNEAGQIVKFDLTAVNNGNDNYLIKVSFDKSGNAWVKPTEIINLTAQEETALVSLKETEGLVEPLKNYMLKNFKVSMKESGMKQLQIEISSALGKTIISFKEIPVDTLSKVANDFVSDPDYVELFDREFAGESPASDDLNKQVPVVFRDQDHEDNYNPNTKDFGEVYHQDKFSPPSMRVRTSSIRLSRLDKKAAGELIQYISDDGSVKKPEELGVMIDPSNFAAAPDEMNHADGKKYKKQIVQSTL